MHGTCPTDNTICLALSGLVSHFTEDSRCLALIDSTVGVRMLLTGAWRAMFDDTHITIDMAAIAQVLSRLKLIRNTSDREELSEGAGGRFADFVTLLARYIDLVVPTARSEVTYQTHYYICAILPTINSLGSGDQETMCLLIPSMTRILSTFTRYAGLYIPSTTRGLSATDDVLGAILLTIYSSCTRIQRARLFRQLVDTGILRALVGFALRGTEVEYTSKLLALISKSTVFFSVVSQMEAGFEDAQDLLADPAFPNSALFGAWTEFRALAEDRITLAKSWQLSGRGTRKACDNVEVRRTLPLRCKLKQLHQCASIGPKGDFKCCGYCHTVYYCSRACQLVDWNRGDHHANCAQLRVFGQGTSASASVHRDPLMTPL